MSEPSEVHTKDSNDFKRKQLLMSDLNPLRVVLQVDDSAAETLLLESAFAAAGIGEYLRAVDSGPRALNYLEGKGEFADRQKFPAPCLVLLDVKMPVMNGFDLLVKIRAHPQFQALPVSMYSTSSQEVDIQRALQLGADSYLEKPLGFRAQVELAQSIADTWFRGRAQQHGRPRILLRKRCDPRQGSQAGLYLQPGGHWSENRETARLFTHTVDAHWWAKEQQYLNAEVVLAYPDPGRDYSCMQT